MKQVTVDKELEWDRLLQIQTGGRDDTNANQYDNVKGKDVVMYLYDIVMENELPEYLQHDFGLTK